MLRDVQLPSEYEKGLEGVLLKEQENAKLGEGSRGVSSSDGAAGQGAVRCHAVQAAVKAEAN
jgi:hypothetical protein